MATVRINNWYTCGRESTSLETVRNPVPGEAPEDWWQLVVHPVTGDGHPCGRSEFAVYTAVIVAIDDAYFLPGDTMTWEG